MAVRVQLPLRWNIYSLWNSDVVNLVWETNEGRGMKHFTRESPKTKYYRDYRKYDVDYFSSELTRQLDSVLCSITENVDYEEWNEFSRLHRVFLNLLYIQAPLKKKKINR